VFAVDEIYSTTFPYLLELGIRNLSIMNILIIKDANNVTITDKANQDFEKRKIMELLF
jgi:hypothetical protein